MGQTSVDAYWVDIPQDSSSREFAEFCEDYDIYPLLGDRRGWIESACTYLRAATQALIMRDEIYDVR